jgi:hypothetical protein
MPYVKNNRLEIIKFAPWYKVGQLSVALADIRKTNFSVTESRNQSLQRLNNLSQSNPLRKGRFDQNDLYVCETMGDWSRKLGQLRSCLAYKDFSNKNRSSRNEAVDHVDLMQKFNDTQVAFQNALVNCFDQISRLEGVYDREKFEAELDLEWVVSEVDPDPEDFREFPHKNNYSKMLKELHKNDFEVKDAPYNPKEEVSTESELVKASSGRQTQSDRSKKGMESESFLDSWPKNTL